MGPSFHLIDDRHCEGFVPPRANPSPCLVSAVFVPLSGCARRFSGLGAVGDLRASSLLTKPPPSLPPNQSKFISIPSFSLGGVPPPSRRFSHQLPKKLIGFFLQSPKNDENNNVLTQLLRRRLGFFLEGGKDLRDHTPPRPTQNTK